jgi:hypothetical protein
MDLVPTSAFERLGVLWLPRAVPAPQSGIPRPAPEPPPATIRMVGGRRMQCKDIPDETFLDAVRRTPGTPVGNWRMRWKVQAELEKQTGPIPENLFLAKVRRLFARGLLGGCDCGCRGDYHLSEECNDPEHCCPPRNPSGT